MSRNIDYEKKITILKSDMFLNEQCFWTRNIKSNVLTEATITQASYTPKYIYNPIPSPPHPHVVYIDNLHRMELIPIHLLFKIIFPPQC